MSTAVSKNSSLVTSAGLHFGACAKATLLVQYWRNAYGAPKYPNQLRRKGAHALRWPDPLATLRSKTWLAGGLSDAIRFPQRNNRDSISEALLALLYPIILGKGVTYEKVC